MFSRLKGIVLCEKEVLIHLLKVGSVEVCLNIQCVQEVKTVWLLPKERALPYLVLLMLVPGRVIDVLCALLQCKYRIVHLIQLNTLSFYFGFQSCFLAMPKATRTD